MRGFKRNPWLFGLGLLAIPVWFGGQALADINNDQAGSLIIYPKVIADGERDTVIKLTNRSNMPAYAHCFYTNALGTCSEFGNPCTDDSQCDNVLSGEVCEVDWTVTNFDIFLTAQQPTFWRVSTGRFGDLLQPSCTMGNPCVCDVNAVSGALECPGFDAGAQGGIGSIAIIGTGEEFAGELRCYQTMDDFATPLAQNSLVGEAIIQTLATGQISTYDAVHVTATSPNTDNDLLLDNNEYNACPEQLIFAHHGEGATATVAEVDDVAFSTEMTLVPCTALYETGDPVTASVNIFTYDEMELRLSADGVPVTCFQNARLSAPQFGGIFDAALGDRDYLKTRIVVNSGNICLTGDNAGTPCSGNGDCPNFATTADGTQLGCRPSPGVVGVVEEFYSAPSTVGDGHAAWSMTLSGSRTAPDIIVVPDPVP